MYSTAIVTVGEQRRPSKRTAYNYTLCVNSAMQDSQIILSRPFLNQKLRRSRKYDLRGNVAQNQKKPIQCQILSVESVLCSNSVCSGLGTWLKQTSVTKSCAPPDTIRRTITLRQIDRTHQCSHFHHLERVTIVVQDVAKLKP